MKNFWVLQKLIGTIRVHGASSIRASISRIAASISGSMISPKTSRYICQWRLLVRAFSSGVLQVLSSPSNDRSQSGTNASLLIGFMCAPQKVESVLYKIVEHIKNEFVFFRSESALFSQLEGFA